MRCPLHRLVGRISLHRSSIELNPKPVRRPCLAIRDRPIVLIQERAKRLCGYAPQPRLAANLQNPQNQPCPGTGVGPPVRLRTDTMFKATLRAVLLGLSVRIRVSRRPNDFSGFRISPRNRGLSGSKRRAPASANDDPDTASARSRWQRSMIIRRVAVLRMRTSIPIETNTPNWRNWGGIGAWSHIAHAGLALEHLVGDISNISPIAQKDLVAAAHP